MKAKCSVSRKYSTAVQQYIQNLASEHKNTVVNTSIGWFGCSSMTRSHLAVSDTGSTSCVVHW